MHIKPPPPPQQWQLSVFSVLHFCVGWMFMFFIVAFVFREQNIAPSFHEPFANQSFALGGVYPTGEGG